jgi:tRNA (mo5U34)-methyltransferase
MTSLEQEIGKLGPWFHNIHLPDGTQTAPDHYLGDFPAWKWAELAPVIPSNLTGWTALDVGCNAGYYSFELARRGARVTAIDMDAQYLAQGRWAAVRCGLEDQVEFRLAQVYDLARWNQTFDLVLFMGVLYHLRYPMLGLDLVAQKVGRLLVFQSMLTPGEELSVVPRDRGLNEREALRDPGWPKLAFIEHRLAGDPTNWWIPNHAGVEAMLRSSGMRVVSRMDAETYICEPDLDRPSSVSTWNSSELRAAVGLPWQDEVTPKLEHWYPLEPDS